MSEHVDKQSDSSYEVRIGVQPTLFIALGGTGMEIVHRLRRRILERDWGTAGNPVHLASIEEFPLAEFIYYDMDERASISGQKVASADPSTNLVRFAAHEKLIRRLDLDKYFKSEDTLDRYPNISSWFPISGKTMCELNINMNYAPGSIRAFSRLYFFDNYHELKAMIQSKIDSLMAGTFNRGKLDHLGLKTEQDSLRVVVIASSSGDTGSGSFLDMGYLVKCLVNRATRGAAFIDLYLMLPSGHSFASRDRCFANTYAALMELETCIGHGIRLLKGWSEREEINFIPEKPYDNVFLFDAFNTAKKENTTLVDAFNMMADVLIDEYIRDEFACFKRTVKIKHAQYKVGYYQPPFPEEFGKMMIRYSRAYSTFGQSSIDMETIMRTYETSICEGHDNVLLDTLEKMPQQNRVSLFQNCLATALPWVKSEMGGKLIPNSNQIMCVIGTKDARLFEKKFGHELGASIPANSEMKSRDICFYETSTPGKLTCYVEISGVPLDALSRLHEWRESYNKERHNVPVHIHRDNTLFVHPLVLTTRELADRASDFRLFLLAVMLRILTRRPYGNGMLGQYLFDFDHDDRRNFGNERAIRMDGIPAAYRPHLEEIVRDRLGMCDPSQLMALSILANIIGRVTYAPKTGRDQNYMEYLIPSFPHIIALKLSEELEMSARRKGLDEDRIRSIENRFVDWDALSASLDAWTEEIPGSAEDAYPWEVQAPDDSVPNRLKRRVKREFLDSGWIYRMVSPPEKSSAHIQTDVGQREADNIWWAAIDGQKCGPLGEDGLIKLISEGKMVISTKVWRKGMSGWTSAGEVEDVATLFDLPSSLDDDAPPPLPWYKPFSGG